MTAAAKSPFRVANHWRPIVAGLAGLTGGLGALPCPLLQDHPILFGWDVFALTYIALLWWLFVTAGEQDIRDRAAQQDDGAGMVVLVVAGSTFVSLGGIVVALLRPGGDHPLLTFSFVAVTLAAGWGLMHSMFVPHYAHRHFAAVASNPEAGFGFTGEPPRSYLDFAYLAVTVGATFQVSDNSVGSTKLRNLVTAHALAAYVYNTAILAVGISLLASAISH